jgi:3-isopropylmalate dehydratase small subunit
VGGVDVGLGDGDLRAATATLRRLGVGALIARSFGEPFYHAAIERGLAALVIEEAEAIKPGDRLRVDIEEHKIANRSSGDRYIIRNLYDQQLDVLRAGGLGPYRVLQARDGGTHQ